MAKNKHITLEDRYVIQHRLEEHKSFRQIGNDIGKEPSTVSKEILGHYEVVETGAYGRGFNPCALACVWVFWVPWVYVKTTISWSMSLKSGLSAHFGGVKST